MLEVADDVRKIGALQTLGASHNLARIRSDINGGNGLIVTGELVIQGEARAIVLVELNSVVACDGKELAIGREGVVRNALVKEEVDFWGRHGDRSSTQLSLAMVRRRE